MKKLIAFLFPTPELKPLPLTAKQKAYYNSIGKPEQHPQAVRIQRTAMPCRVDMKTWMGGVWGKVPNVLATYKLGRFVES